MLQRIDDLLTELIQCGGNISIDQFNRLYTLREELMTFLDTNQREMPCFLTSECRKIKTTLEAN